MNCIFDHITVQAQIIIWFKLNEKKNSQDLLFYQFCMALIKGSENEIRHRKVTTNQ